MTHVENRTFGPVKFMAIEQDAGHVQGSTAEIWTAIPKMGVKMLNILHFHINDMSEEVPIDTRWLTQAERDLLVNDRLDQIRFPEFKKDANGVLLRYLILIHNQAVIAILYNPSEQDDPEMIKYREYRVDPDQYQCMWFSSSV